MKRILIIAILISYSLASVGVSLNYFYCCGKLEKVTLAITAEQKLCKSKAKGCCENKSVIVKLKTDQKNLEQKLIHFPTLHSPAILPGDNLNFENLASSGKINPLYKRPPPDLLPSRQILYCVFRI